MPEALREFLSNTGKVQLALHKSTLRNIVRMQNRPAESDIKTINQLMMKPTMFLEFGRRGDPHWRKFSLVCQGSNNWSIKWETKKKGKVPEIKVLSMTDVHFGQHSDVFKRKTMPHLNSLSFSVYYNLPNNKGVETLDLIAKHPDDFFVWTVGLKHAVTNGGIGHDPETSEWQRQEDDAEGNGVAAMATDGASHVEIPRPFHLTKKGHESIEVFRIASGDNFTLVLDDEGGLMLLGVNPNNNSGKAVNMSLDLEKTTIPGIDGIVTEIAAGGRHISVLAPKRFAYSSLL